MIAQVLCRCSAPVRLQYFPLQDDLVPAQLPGKGGGQRIGGSAEAAGINASSVFPLIHSQIHLIAVN